MERLAFNPATNVPPVATANGRGPVANYHHMLKRRGQAEYEAVPYELNIPPWKERGRAADHGREGQLYVRVVERINKERVIYTEEIDLLCLVDWVGEQAHADTL